MITNLNTQTTMLLEPKDLEAIERIIFRNNDEFALSIAQGFERLEERLDAAEARLYSRLADLENLLAKKDE